MQTQQLRELILKELPGFIQTPQVKELILKELPSFIQTPPVKKLILKELPSLVQNDKHFQKVVLDISRGQFANKVETDNRFDHLLKRLDQKLEEDRQKWEENRQMWAAQREKDRQMWETFQQKLEENRQEFKRDLEENRQEFKRDLEENRQEFKRDLEEHRQEVKQDLEENRNFILKRIEQKLGALGARWGEQTEASFRNALRGILKDIPNIQVIRVDERDEEGVVFGYPEEIELDLIIRNGVLMIAEMKSHIAKHDVYIFDKKVRFYEQKHNRQANKLIIISPQVKDKAFPAAKQLGIEIYSYIEDIGL